MWDKHQIVEEPYDGKLSRTVLKPSWGSDAPAQVNYHRILKCFVLIDLKRGEIEHNDIGQMNMYLNYFKKEETTEGDNEPIGIVLGAYKDKVLIEYATQGISNQLFVSRYQLYLPDKKQLQDELRKLMDYE